MSFFGSIYSQMLDDNETIKNSYDILAGKLTFQRAFMTGAITAKGNFKILRLLDDMFLSEQLV
jgi:putative sterol carrier protein